MDNSAPLALKFNPPSAFGTSNELDAIVDRMSALMPNAVLADWQLGSKYRDDAERNLKNAFLKVAQLAVFYRLIPGVDLHVMPRKNQFIVDIGLESWRKAADRYCAQHGISYHIHTKPLSEAEVKERRGNDWMPADVGAVASLWRSDKEGAYRVFGADSMTQACGVWAEKATWNDSTKKWIPDTIPAQRTKMDVAERRAIRAVLKKEFSLDSLLAATPAEISQNVRYLESDIRHEQMRRAVPNDRRPEVDDDGFIIVEPSKPRPTVDDVQFIVAEDTDMDDEPDFDEFFEDDTDSADGAQNDYRALAATLTGHEALFVDWAKQAHVDSRGPASPEQYRYLTGVLDKICADKRGHTLILSVMIGRHVDGTNTPGTRLCGRLLEWLRPEVTDEVTGEKIANPAYRPDYVRSIKAMWQTLQATANGVRAWLDAQKGGTSDGS